MTGQTSKYFIDQLRESAQFYPWKAALLRMVTDVIFLNGSILAAFFLWYIFYTQVLAIPDPAMLEQFFRTYFVNYWAFWSAVALLVFHLSGFYSRTRGYASRHKTWVIVRAICLTYVLFVFF